MGRASALEATAVTRLLMQVSVMSALPIGPVDHTEVVRLQVEEEPSLLGCQRVLRAAARRTAMVMMGMVQRHGGDVARMRMRAPYGAGVWAARTTMRMRMLMAWCASQWAIDEHRIRWIPPDQDSG